MWESGTEPDLSDPSGGMETKDGKSREWARELTLGEPLVWRPPATRSKRSPSAECGEIFPAEAHKSGRTQDRSFEEQYRW
jgi:hypothetical protein